jgi:endonuclease YncB( thermonuclease family)
VIRAARPCPTMRTNREAVVRSPSSLAFWIVVIALVAGVLHVVREFGGVARGVPGAVTAPGGGLAGRARVVDGDSLDVAGERIRLYGIDAPEYRQSCNDLAGRPYACGRAASRALAALIAGRPVSCNAVDHDRYGRDVAICMVDGRDLGEVMVRAGHALDYAQHSRGRYAAAQRDARDAKRGMWAGSFEDPAVWRRKNPR